MVRIDKISNLAAYAGGLLRLRRYWMSEDRRRSQRVPKVATIAACGDGTKQVEGAVVNISEKGLCFYANQLLEPGHVMKVEGIFRLENFSRDCEIVWCSKVGTGLYKIGIAFGKSR